MTKEAYEAQIAELERILKCHITGLNKTKHKLRLLRAEAGIPWPGAGKKAPGA